MRRSALLSLAVASVSCSSAAFAADQIFVCGATAGQQIEAGRFFPPKDKNALVLWSRAEINVTTGDIKFAEATPDKWTVAITGNALGRDHVLTSGTTMLWVRAWRKPVDFVVAWNSHSFTVYQGTCEPK
jgi:hypothetical protein